VRNRTLQGEHPTSLTLGLTVVREILVQHRFESDLDNVDGGGARFRLRC
jgi:hypothetical protein